MTGAVLGLLGSYAILAVLLLSLNLRSAWHWLIKAAAIVLTCGFFVAAFMAIEALLGWPTEAPPPAHFQLHAALVLEPDRGRPGGAIYLWLSPRAPDGDVAGAPRAHALPYSRALHEQTELGPAAPAGGPADRGHDQTRQPAGQPFRAGPAVRGAAPDPAAQGRVVIHGRRLRLAPADAPAPGRNSAATGGRRAP